MDWKWSLLPGRLLRPLLMVREMDSRWNFIIMTTIILPSLFIVSTQQNVNRDIRVSRFMFIVQVYVLNTLSSFTDWRTDRRTAYSKEQKLLITMVFPHDFTPSWSLSSRPLLPLLQNTNFQNFHSGCDLTTEQPPSIISSHFNYLKEIGSNLTIAVTSRPSHLILSHILYILLKVRIVFSRVHGPSVSRTEMLYGFGVFRSVGEFKFHCIETLPALARLM